MRPQKKRGPQKLSELSGTEVELSGEILGEDETFTEAGAGPEKGHV